jgi:hypothetical protein
MKIFSNLLVLNISRTRIISTLLFSCVCLANCSAQDTMPIVSYEECVKAGNVILRSLPPQCVTREGQRFVSDEQKPANKIESEQYCQNLCGDGSCQVLVCKSVGCPCPESPSVCPKDCKE